LGLNHTFFGYALALDDDRIAITSFHSWAVYQRTPDGQWVAQTVSESRDGRDGVGLQATFVPQTPATTPQAGLIRDTDGAVLYIEWRRGTYRVRRIDENAAVTTLDMLPTQWVNATFAPQVCRTANGDFVYGDAYQVKRKAIGGAPTVV